MKKTLHWLWLIALVLAPIVLWLLPADTFNEGPALCPSVLLLSLECFACGITRAVMHFHHFDFTEAIYYNLLVVVVYPFLVWLWQFWLRAELRYLNLYPGLSARPPKRA